LYSEQSCQNLHLMGYGVKFRLYVHILLGPALQGIRKNVVTHSVMITMSRDAIQNEIMRYQMILISGMI